MLMVSPQHAQARMIEVRMESGMETAMISVLRQLPRNSRIMRPVRHAAITASRITPLTAARTKIGLIGQRLNLQRRRQGGGDARQQLADAVDHVERRGVAGLHDGQQHAAAAILAHDVGLRREAVAHVRHVADIDGRAVDHLDRQIVELVHGLGAGVQIHVVFELADLGGAGGKDQVLVADGGHDVGRREPFGLQQRRV